MHFAKIKVGSYDSLPTGKMVTLHNVIKIYYSNSDFIFIEYYNIMQS